MKAPRGLVGAGLLFWGWQTGLWAAAAPLALILEAGPSFPRRLDLSRQQFHRVSDLCTLLFFASAVLLYTTREPADALRLTVIGLPGLLLPLILAQACSVQRAVDGSVFYWSWKERQNESGPRRGIDVGYPYLAACVFAASAANRREGDFYAGLVLLSGWALWGARRPGAPALLWAALLAAAGLLGQRGHGALNAMQGRVEELGTGLAYRLARSGKSPFSVRTAIGSIGAVKGSGLILLRVEPEPGEPVPPLLRNAAYNEYSDGTWSARSASFSEAVQAGEGDWPLASGEGRRRLRLSARLPGGAGLLGLPAGTTRLSGLRGALRVNRLGAARVDDGPALAVFDAAFRVGALREGPPDAADLEVPEALRGTLSRLAEELSLDGSRPERALAAVRRHFDAGYSYSVYQGERPRGDPIEHFLLRGRKGHCEYFATAAVLLLRAAGVPARYATGYAVSEYSRLEGAYVVRQRHAHAWAQAFAGGRWVDVDTTPASWADVEEARASSWQPVKDVFSFLGHRVRRELRGGLSEFLRRRGAWVVLPLMAFLALRIAADLRGARARRARASAALARRGLDSEFYAVEERLRAAGLGRRPEETTAAWLARLRATPGQAAAAERLEDLAALHERYRFDPAGLAPEERRALREGAAAWSAGPSTR